MGRNWTVHYEYNTSGNRIKKTTIENPNEYYGPCTESAVTSTYDKSNRLISTLSDSIATVYTYDANGNTLTAGDKTYTYDSQNRQKTVIQNGITTNYNYSATGLRSEKYVSGNHGSDYVWDDGNLIYEYSWDSDNSPSLYEGLVYNHGLGLISYSDYNDEHVLYERNAHGDVVMAIKNSNGNYQKFIIQRSKVVK